MNKSPNFGECSAPINLSSEKDQHSLSKNEQNYQKEIYGKGKSN